MELTIKYKIMSRLVACCLLVVMFFIPLVKAINLPNSSELYLLELKTKNYILHNNIPAYFVDEQLYLGFNAFLQATEFQIFSEGNGQWEGWFFTQHNTFLLDQATKQVHINDKMNLSLQAKEMYESRDGIFIALTSLEQWFNVKFSPNLRQQTLGLSSVQPFAIEQRDKRDGQIQPVKTINTDTPFKIEDQYQWLTYPRAYFQGGMNTVSTDNQSANSKYASVTSSFDLLKHHTFYSGSMSTNSRGQSNDLHRLTFERRASTEKGQLFGGAGRYQFGDIYLSSNNLATQGGRGTGLVIERNHNKNNVAEGTVVIEGNASPGWDVELYRNGQLQHFSVSTSAGRYIFTDQTTLPGKNIFTVHLYGPQGQYEEHEHLVWGGGLALDPDDFTYRLATVDFSKELLNGNKENLSYLPAKRSNVIEFDYGLHRNFQLGLGFYNTEIIRETLDSIVTETSQKSTYAAQNYWVANFRANLFSGILLGELSKQHQAKALAFRYYGNLGDHSFSLAHQYFEPEFVSPYNVLGIRLKTRNELMFNGPGVINFFDRYTLKIASSKHQSHIEKFDVNLQLSKRFRKININNDLKYSNSAGSKSLWQGNFQVSSRFDQYSLSGNILYAPKKSRFFNAMSATFRWHINKLLFTQSQFTQQFDQRQDSYFRQELTWQHDKFNLSFNGDVGSNNTWALGITISTSLGFDNVNNKYWQSRDNLSNRASLSLNAFIDENNNDQLDANEFIVEQMKHPQATSNSINDRNYIVINDVPAYNKYQLNTQKIQLPDVYLMPKYKSYEIYTHPGSELVVNIPVRPTGDIQGMVVMQENGEQLGVAGLVVELIAEDGELTQETLTEFDGYYSFLNQPMGPYQLLFRYVDDNRLLKELTIILDGEEGFIDVEPVVIPFK
jgi:hypothetical protein